MRGRSPARMGLFLMSYLGIAISLWPLHRAAPLHAVGRRLRAQHAGFPAGRHAVPAAGDHHVHGVVVLGVPRQGARRYRLSLNHEANPIRAPRPAWRRQAAAGRYIAER